MGELLAVPIHRAPEESNEQLKNKILEMLKLERMAFNYFVETEQLLGGLEKLHETLTFDGIVKSGLKDAYIERICGERELKLREELSQKGKRSPEQDVESEIIDKMKIVRVGLENDFCLSGAKPKHVDAEEAYQRRPMEPSSHVPVYLIRKLLLAEPKLFRQALRLSMLDLERNKLNKDKANFKSEAEFNAVLISRVRGQVARLTYSTAAGCGRILKNRMEHPLSSVSRQHGDNMDEGKLSDQELLRLHSYELLKQHKGFAAMLDRMKSGIKTANDSKFYDALRSREELGNIYGLEVNEIDELNNELNSFFDEYLEDGLDENKSAERKKLQAEEVAVKQRKVARRATRLAGMSPELRAEAEADFKAKTEKQEKLDAQTKKWEKMTAQELQAELGNLVEKNFSAAYVNYRGELQHLYEQLIEGRIVETADIKEYIERAIPALTKNPPLVVYFHGDYGTGKTALAVHIARTRLHKEPILVSGSKFMEPDEFTEGTKIQRQSEESLVDELMDELGLQGKLVGGTSGPDLIAKKVVLKKYYEEQAHDAYYREQYGRAMARDGRKFTEEGFIVWSKEKEKEDANSESAREIKAAIEQKMNNPVQTIAMRGAIYEAMETGAPLIIDEANALTPEVLISFNDLLTKKVGDHVKTRTKKEGYLTVKEGFCIIWTGNTGDRYRQARNNIDPASYSRICPIKVGYLSQTVSASTPDDLMKRLGLDQEDIVNGLNIADTKELAKNDQIFQVLVVKLLNKRLGAELLVRKDDRYSVFKDLYKLSVAARQIMNLFEKNTDGWPAGYFDEIGSIVGGSGTPTEMAEKLVKTNLTMRELIDNIIGGYLDEGCRMDIEYYAFNFVQKYAEYPKEQAIVYHLLRKAGFFSSATGSNFPAPTAGMTEAQYVKMMNAFNPLAKVPKYLKIEQNGNMAALLDTKGEYEYTYISSLEIIQLVYGHLPAREYAEYVRLQALANREKMRVASDNEKGEDLLELIAELPKIINSVSVRAFRDMNTEAMEAFTAKLYELGIFTRLESMKDDEIATDLRSLRHIFMEALTAVNLLSAEEATDIDNAPGGEAGKMQALMKHLESKK